MKRFKLEQSNADIVSHSGLALVGQAIKRYTPLSTTLDIKVPLRHGIRHSDVVKSYLALLSTGKNDFEAFNNIGNEFYLMNAMSVGEIPCEATLRQRMDKQANAFLPILKTASIDFLSHINPTLTPASSGHMNVIYAQMKNKSGETLDDSDVLDVVRQQVNELLDESIESIYIGSNLPDPVNISDIDFDALSEIFKRTTNPRISDAEKLKNLIQLKIGPMVERNRTRQDLQEKFQLLIDEYNNGTYTTEQFFEALKQFIDELGEEERRGVRVGLNEEELAIFDLLCEGAELSGKERDQVKTIAQQLLEKIRDDLVIDWRKKQQTKARVKDHIQAVLDDLPDSYDDGKWDNAFDSVYQHVYQAYRG
jgi:hypothetical protein